MKARYAGTCRRCGFDYPIGTDIHKLAQPHYGWGHINCPSSLEEAQKTANETIKADEVSEVSRVQDDRFSVAFKYDPDVTNIFRNLPERRGEKNGGFRWWVPADYFNDVVQQLLDLGTDPAKRLANEMIEGSRFAPARRLRDKALARLEQSRVAEVEDVDVPCPKGLAYRPFQLAFIAWAMAIKNILLGDEMGLGKTVEALGLINARSSIRRALVICPASLRYNWKREAEKWLVGDWTVSVVEGIKGKGWPKSFNSGRHLVIISYDICNRAANKKKLHAFEWDLLTIDEAHYLKNKDAQRTKAILGYWDKKTKQAVEGIRAKRNLFMTGTPIPNRVSELWNMLKKLDPQGLGRSWKLYMTRYAEAYQDWVRTPNGMTQVWVTSGAAHLDELQRTMRSRFMMRRLKKDVAKELPPKDRQLIILPPNGTKSLIKKEQKLQEQLKKEQLEREIAAAIAEATSTSYEELLGSLYGETPAFDESAKLRHEIALKKVPAVVEHVRNVATSTGKVVVFAWHRDVIDAILAQLRKGDKDNEPLGCVSVVGGMGAKKADEQVQRFQTDDTISVFVGNIAAAGVGHTLTAASNVVFAELPWRPCDANQAEDRCHRHGQDADVVTIQHIVYEDSMDVYMANMLLEKQKVADGALDDLGATAPDFEAVDVDDESFQVRFHKSVFEASQKREERAEKEEQRSKAQAAERERILRVARILTPEQIEAVHECLSELAAVCDGARVKDFAGFNAVDTGVGRMLGRKASLTAEEAALGREIIPTYKRQIGHLEAFKVALSAAKE